MTEKGDSPHFRKGDSPLYRGRFAPSPTGPLHFGSLVAAVASWLDARAVGGEWLVRIEDVDATRTVPGAAEDILRTLEALGLTWDGAVEWQGNRKAIYDNFLERLRSSGYLYRCRCSRKEIADSGAQGLEGVVYPGTCRNLGLPPAVAGADRIRTNPGNIDFEDRLQGPIVQDLAANIGDFVLKRRDGLHAYQLAVVVDDAEQGITDVVRGADLLLSTPRQILLQRLLDLPTPRYLHTPVATRGGIKLSKQTQAPALDAREAVPALKAVLAFLGQPAVPGATAAEVLAHARAAWDPLLIPVSRQLEAPTL
ncbi:tRNA glutamyl-Q(34) synthetase GluQRS [Usitatibacter palustris]|uniref:Glutamyl-Q tRNA(Asp) synthetase n=1 Tax=Usitatibacter palustris TaxID=2732487 RepID=A0A6M4H8S6_9PROT|nr:tRNA glutamyl-Q(34) synthetase GluQRS [Usitatibacter palustris]QJR16119.1 Glutamyl-Q tRNA(Asp) synthetase [Usitatibacter palustris]